MYGEIIRNRELIADILPPPEYIIESYLVVNQAFTANVQGNKTELPQLRATFIKLKGEYEERHAHWQKELAAGEVKLLLLEESYRPAMEFYKIAGEVFFPALEKGDTNSVSASLVRLGELYTLHRTRIDRLSTLASKDAAHNEQEVATFIKYSSTLPIIVGLGIALLIVVVRLKKTSGSLKGSEKQIREQLNEIRQINETLEEQVAERTRDLLENQQRLEESNCELATQFVQAQELQNELARTLAQLQNREENYATIIQSALDGFCLLDTQGRLLEVNESYCRISGYSREELLTMTIADLERCEVSLDFAARIEMIVTNGSDYFVAEHIRKGGGACDVEVNVQYRPVDSGRIAMFVRDITDRTNAERELQQKTLLLENLNYALTEQQQSVQEYIAEQATLLELLRRSEALYHSLVETAQDLIWQCDHEGRYTYLNLAWEMILGYNHSEILGMEFSDFQTPASAVESRMAFARLMAGESIEHHEATFIGKSGNEVHLVFNARSMLDNKGGIAGASGTAFDITKRILLEVELNSSKAAAEQANISKSQFLSNMSHEIRTPLNAIIGFSTILLKSALPSIEQDFIKKINTAGATLLNVVNDILDFSKIEAGQLEMEETPFKLETTLTNVINIIQPVARGKGLNLLVKSTPEVASCLVGDPLRLGQVLINLLNNAVKFTEHGMVMLDTSLLQQENGRQQIKFNIRDTGIGISADRIGKLFQPFSQADESTTRRFGGTGLGLSISKQLVELMGGEVWCKSTPGLGSTFTFTAWFGLCQEHDPLQSSSYDESVNENNQLTYDFSPFTVLLVEDNEVNQQLAVELLKDTGVSITVVNNGVEAVTAVTEGNAVFDLILMDIQMPVMDGYDATRLIRENGRFANLPIIAMTAHAMKEEQNRITQAGMDMHITKPIDVRVLLQVMDLFLRPHVTPAPLLPAPPRDNPVRARQERLPLHIPGLDVDNALSRLNEKVTLYHKLLVRFVDNWSAVVQDIEEALRSGDVERAVRLAHTVKSSAGTIGAVALAERADELETAVANGQPPDAVFTGPLPPFARELGRIIAELITYNHGSVPV